MTTYSTKYGTYSMNPAEAAAKRTILNGYQEDLKAVDTWLKAAIEAEPARKKSLSSQASTKRSMIRAQIEVLTEELKNTPYGGMTQEDAQVRFEERLAETKGKAQKNIKDFAEMAAIDPIASAGSRLRDAIRGQWFLRLTEEYERMIAKMEAGEAGTAPMSYFTARIIAATELTEALSSDILNFVKYSLNRVDPEEAARFSAYSAFVEKLAYWKHVAEYLDEHVEIGQFVA